MLDLRERVRLFLRQNKERADKKLGQHFLVDEDVLAGIMRAANVRPDETIVEIGPGFGILTEKLLEQAAKVIAIEKDPKMIELLSRFVESSRKLTIMNENILQADLSKIGKYSIVANVPYYITSPILRNFLTMENKPERMILMIQKEVAERIVTDPPDSVLAFSIQFYALPELIFKVRSSSFLPPPEVDSAVVRVITRQKPAFEGDERSIFRMVKAAFGERRKQLANSLAGGLSLSSVDARNSLASAGIDPTRRAETLSMHEWERLYKELSDKINT